MSEGKGQAKRSAKSLETVSNEQFLKLLGERVKNQRMKVSMSRKLLAKESGVSERYLAQLESGKGNISITLLRQVTVAMGVTLEHLFASLRAAALEDYGIA